MLGGAKLNAVLPCAGSSAKARLLLGRGRHGVLELLIWHGASCLDMAGHYCFKLHLTSLLNWRGGYTGSKLLL